MASTSASSPTTEAEGRAICAERYKVAPDVRSKRRRANAAKATKGRTSRRRKEPAEAAPAPGTPAAKASCEAA